MRRRIETVSLGDLRRRYPETDITDFVPEYLVRVEDTQTKQLLRQDYVQLDPSPQCDYGLVPGETRPLYARLPTKLWQCLEVHGRVTATPVRFRPDFIPRHDLQGFVYFAEAEGSIKIGWSSDVARRLEELQTGNPRKIRLLGAFPGTMHDEAALHRKFGHLRLEGEWFRGESELRSFVASQERPHHDPQS